MNATFKLVVVQPFNQYKRGDVITDQTIVQAILDVNNTDMHPYEMHVRRVLWTDAEKKALQAPVETVINISSIKE